MSLLFVLFECGSYLYHVANAPFHRDGLQQQTQDARPLEEAAITASTVVMPLPTAAMERPSQTLADDAATVFSSEAAADAEGRRAEEAEEAADVAVALAPYEEQTAGGQPAGGGQPANETGGASEPPADEQTPDPDATLQQVAQPAGMRLEASTGADGGRRRHRPYRSPSIAHCQFNALVSSSDRHRRADGALMRQKYLPLMTSCAYNSKPRYNASAPFRGSFVMNRNSIPSVGEPLQSPWYIVKPPRRMAARPLGSVTRGLVDALPQHDLLSSGMFRSCAVVGNGGNLLQQPFGKEIDAHDAVFRFNSAPTKGFQRHVGSRTTVRLVNRHHQFFREQPEELVLQHVTMPEILTEYVRRKKATPALNTYPLDMTFYEAIVDWRRVPFPTNGFLGLRLALHICHNITVYGFLRSWRGWVPYHYFNSEEPDPAQRRRDSQGELPIIKDLLSEHCERMAFRHPCNVDQLCASCPAAAAICDGVAPFPVPTPGHCKVEGTDCFIACHSTAQCPGGVKGICSADIAATGSCEPPRPVEQQPSQCEVWRQHNHRKPAAAAAG